MKIYIGTSGWQYYHWKNKFYPKNLPPKEWLKFYSKYFNTVEINTTFYHLTRKTTFEKWKKNVNKNFLFSIKLYRLFTHFRKLNLNKEDKKILKECIENTFVLNKNLGVILIQLPPTFRKNLKKLSKFIKTLKNITKNKVLISIEFRHKSWLEKDVYKILKNENIAFCISDSPRWPTDIVKTANFIYVRFHGKPLFVGKYDNKELDYWVNEIKKLKPKKLFIYFNNDFKANAVENALYLKTILK